jgi:hypothetical protein
VRLSFVTSLLPISEHLGPILNEALHSNASARILLQEPFYSSNLSTSQLHKCTTEPTQKAIFLLDIILKSHFIRLALNSAQDPTMSVLVLGLFATAETPHSARQKLGTLADACRVGHMAEVNDQLASAYAVALVSLSV